MTISMVCSLVVLLLLLSIHACNARQLGVITKKDSEESFHLLNKGQQISSNLNIRVLDPSNAQSSGSNEFDEAAINKDFQQEIIKTHDEHYPRKNLGEIQGHGNVIKSSSSPSTISWNVPHRKKGGKQQQPGFNLDYSPPKTHPPVHN